MFTCAVNVAFKEDKCHLFSSCFSQAEAKRSLTQVHTLLAPQIWKLYNKKSTNLSSLLKTYKQNSEVKISFAAFNKKNISVSGLCHIDFPFHSACSVSCLIHHARSHFIHLQLLLHAVSISPALLCSIFCCGEDARRRTRLILDPVVLCV